MKKKYIIILIFLATTSLLAIYFFYSKTSPSKTKYKISNNNIQSSKITSKALTRNKFKKNKTKDDGLSIEDLHPCEVLEIQETKLWKHLPKETTIYKYNSLIENLDKFTDKTNFTSKDFDHIENFLDTTMDHLEYMPFLPEIITKIESFSTKDSRKKEMITRLENYFNLRVHNSIYFEDHLMYSKYIYDKKDYDESLRIIHQIIDIEKDIDSKFKNSSVYQDFYQKSLREVKTPNQLALIIIELSRLPTPDFTHLINLKERYPNKNFQHNVDKIAERLISTRLNSKDSRSTDFLSYNIALKIHSKSSALKERYGNYEDLQERIFEQEDNESPFDNQECDDRQIIDLCEKYCNK